MVLFFNNQKIFTVLLSKLSWSAFREGGGDLSISYLKQNCFSHGEGSFKESVKSVQSALSDLKRPPERLQSQYNHRLFIT